MEQAKGELAPGGLAMVYGLVVDVDLNGRSVSLIGQVDDVYPGWRQEGCSFLAGDWACDMGDEEAVFGPHNLMPINPSADPLETTQERDLCQIQ